LNLRTGRLVDALRQLEGPHVRLLVILEEQAPQYQFPDGGARASVWAQGNILGRDPLLAPAISLLVAKLQAVGFIAPDASMIGDEPIWELTVAGRLAVRHLRDPPSPAA
jgi:hypothetical protein